MKYFKDINNNVYAYESDGSQDAYIKQGLTAISEQEKDAILAPSEQQLLDYKIGEAKSYLASTDFYYARKMEIGEDVPADVVIKRVEARKLIRANGG